MLLSLNVNHNCDRPGLRLLTFSNFVISSDCVKSWRNGHRMGRISESPIPAWSRVQTWLRTHGLAMEGAPQVIEFSGAPNIGLDKWSGKLHTDWYVTGYN